MVNMQFKYKISNIFFTILLLLFTIFLLTLNTSSAASTFYVNGSSGNDTWDGTSSVYLNGTIGPMKTINTAVNAVDENGTVNVANGIYYEYVTINKSLNLVGEDRDNTIIDGNHLERPLTISGLSNVSIINVTIRNGYGAFGGGVYSAGNLTMDNCNINGNIAKNYGGGLYATGTTTINNSIITNNFAIPGAGIYYNGDNLTVHFSRLYNDPYIEGGEIYIANGSVDARYNWWGKNTGPEGVSGNITYSPWLYMNLDTNSTLIVNGSTCRINADFNFVCSELYGIPMVMHIIPSIGHLPDGCMVTFTTDLGSFDGSKTTTQNTSNGIATNTLTADEGSGFANVTAQLDAQTLNIIIQMDNPNFNNTTPVPDYDDRYVNYLTGNDTWDGTSLIYINGTVGPMKTIQAAINAVGENGTVHVASGTYYEHLAIGKNLNLVGEDPTTTIIDGNSNGRALYVAEVTDVTIANFTIRYGHSTSNGGGIYSNAGLTVDNCIITDNDAINNGGGLFVTGQTLVKNSIITRNFASAGSGIASAGTGTLTMRYSVIENNPHISSGEIYSLSNPIDAKYNWWGQNSGPKTGQVDASVLYSPWIYMTTTASDYSITNGETCQVFANFNNVCDGSTINSTDPAYGNLTVNFLLFSVIFTTDRGVLSGGIVNNGNNSLQNIQNGVATITLTADDGAGFAHITSKFHFETFNLTIRIHDNSLYVNAVLGNDNFDGTSPIPLIFSNGTVGPKKTIQAAINSIDAGGIVSVASGNYTENILVNKEIILKATEDGSVILNPLNMENAVIMINSEANGSTIRGFVLTGSNNSEIYMENASGISLLSNTINGTFGTYKSLWGICLVNSNGISITNNVVTNCEEGINLYATQNTILSNNTVKDNHWDNIALNLSILNTIKQNTISHADSGIRLVDKSNNNTISQNNLTGNVWTSISMVSSYYNQIIDGNLLSNNQEGIYLYDSHNNTLSGNLVLNNIWDGVAIHNSSYNTLTGHVLISGNNCGIYMMGNSNHNIISLNNINGNTWAGVGLNMARENTITLNNLTDAHVGVYLSEATLNNISQNNITINDWDGIDLIYGSNQNEIMGNEISGSYYGERIIDSSNNTSYMNNFISNSFQVFDNASVVSTNKWDNGSTGNYYSDWSTNTIRPIDGGFSVDRYPSTSSFNYC